MNITEDEILSALNYLRDSAGPAAKARAERYVLEEGRKSVKAQLMTEIHDQALGAQERYAYADARYAAHLERVRAAIEADEMFRMLREAAQAKVSAWQTWSRHERVMI